MGKVRSDQLHFFRKTISSFRKLYFLLKTVLPQISNTSFYRGGPINELCDLVTLCIACHMINPSTSFEYPTIIQY